MIRFALPLCTRVCSLFRPWRLLLAAFWLLSVGVTAAVTWRLTCPPKPPAPADLPRMADWDAPRLVRELNCRGMEAQLTLDRNDDGKELSGGGVVEIGPQSVYVCRDDMPAMFPPPSFAGLPVGNVGPFHDWGDRVVLDRMREALRQ